MCHGEITNKPIINLMLVYQNKRVSPPVKRNQNT